MRGDVVHVQIFGGVKVCFLTFRVPYACVLSLCLEFFISTDKRDDKVRWVLTFTATSGLLSGVSKKSVTKTGDMSSWHKPLFLRSVSEKLPHCVTRMNALW